MNWTDTKSSDRQENIWQMQLHIDEGREERKISQAL